MSRPFSRLPGLAVLAIAASLGLLAAGAAAGPVRRSAPPRLAQPRNLSPRALAVWQWRQAQDERRDEAGFFPAPRGVRSAAEDAPETLLNDTTGTIGYDQNQLAVASYPGRNIVLVWRDNRTGDGDIRCQMFDPTGSPLDAEHQDPGDFVVNDDAGGLDQNRPAVAMNSHGAFVVIWEDPRSGPTDIFLQKFHPDGSRDSSNVKVNIGRDETSRNAHASPSVDIDDGGNMVAAWTDDRRGTTTDVIVTRIRADFLAATNLVPFAGSNTFAFGSNRIEPVDNVAPVIRFTRQSPEDSGSVLVWQAKDIANRGGRRLILARRLSTFDRIRGYPLDTLIVAVNDTLTNSPVDARGASNPVLLASAPDDTARALVVAWIDSSYATQNQIDNALPATGLVRARQLLPSRWTRTAAPFRESSVEVSDAGDSGCLSPYLARFADGSVLVSWAQVTDAGGDAEVRVRRLAHDLSPAGPGEALNASADPLPRSLPAAVAGGLAGGTASWFGAWVERHGQNDDIMVRRGGAGAGADSMLLDERQPDQIHVDLVYNSAGQGVAVWADFRNGVSDPDIYGQRLDASAHPVGGNFRVNSDDGGWYQEFPRVAIAADGSFTVVWEDTRLGTFQVFARRFNSAGAPAGGEFVLSETDTSQQFRPAIAMTPAGAANVVWEDNRRGFRNSNLRVFDIYMLPLSAGGAAVGNTVRVSPVLGDTTATTDPNVLNLQAKLYPSIAMDSAGNGLVFWDVIAKVTQGGGTQIVDNPDVDGRYFLAPSILPDMLDGDGRPIQSQAFSVADSSNSGFLFPQLRSRTAYVGAGLYAVAFEDERLGLLSREDIRARLVGVEVRGGTAVIFTPGNSFAVNDDIVSLTADPITGEVKQLSSSQYQPAVAADLAGRTFTITWSDRRTTTSYNIMSQSYHVLPAEDLDHVPALRFLGRNTFDNADYGLTELAHGAPSVAYSGADKLVFAWQSNQLNGQEQDVWVRAFTQAPDTCVQDTCSRSGVQAHLDAVIASAGSVALNWQVDGAAGMTQLLLVRHDLAQETINPGAAPRVIAGAAQILAGNGMLDPVSGDPSRIVYQLIGDGQVLGTTTPHAPELRFAAALARTSPNPARGVTRVSFVVPGKSGERVPVSLRIFDVTGREVSRLAEGTLAAGEYSRTWRGETHAGVASAGVYFLRYSAGAEVMTHKLLWLR